MIYFRSLNIDPRSDVVSFSDSVPQVQVLRYGKNHSVRMSADVSTHHGIRVRFKARTFIQRTTQRSEMGIPFSFPFRGSLTVGGGTGRASSSRRCDIDVDMLERPLVKQTPLDALRLAWRSTALLGSTQRSQRRHTSKPRSSRTVARGCPCARPAQRGKRRGRARSP